MDQSSDFNVDEFFQELAEIGVGTAILGLRRLNIERRRIVKEIPTLEPAVDAVLDKVEELAGPVSAIVGAAVAGLGDAIAGERGQQLNDAGAVLADMGPELLRMTGLTNRD